MMHEFGIPKGIYYYFLGNLYWFTHNTSTRRFLGIRYSMIVKLLAIILILAAWIYDWGRIPLIISISLLIGLYLAYWHARRAGYFKFVGGKPALPAFGDYRKLPPYKRVPCIATGVFSVQDWEKSVLLKPADYWQVPHGDHALMVEHLPKKYLYQFFNVSGMKDIQQGWLLYGSHPKPALSISYISIWGPEFTGGLFNIFRTEPKPVEPVLRTIHLSFSSSNEEETVFQNILRDLQQHNTNEKRVGNTN
jgi:hypothetical protein